MFNSKEIGNEKSKIRTYGNAMTKTPQIQQIAPIIFPRSVDGIMSP
jgi:hypothetical protein